MRNIKSLLIELLVLASITSLISYVWIRDDLKGVLIVTAATMITAVFSFLLRYSEVSILLDKVAKFILNEQEPMNSQTKGEFIKKAAKLDFSDKYKPKSNIQYHEDKHKVDPKEMPFPSSYSPSFQWGTNSTSGFKTNKTKLETVKPLDYSELIRPEVVAWNEETNSNEKFTHPNLVEIEECNGVEEHNKMMRYPTLNTAIHINMDEIVIEQMTVGKFVKSETGYIYPKFAETSPERQLYINSLGHEINGIVRNYFYNHHNGQEFISLELWEEQKKTNKIILLRLPLDPKHKPFRSHLLS